MHWKFFCLWKIKQVQLAAGRVYATRKFLVFPRHSLQQVSQIFPKEKSFAPSADKFFLFTWVEKADEKWRRRQRIFIKMLSGSVLYLIKVLFLAKCRGKMRAEMEKIKTETRKNPLKTMRILFSLPPYSVLMHSALRNFSEKS